MGEQVSGQGDILRVASVSLGSSRRNKTVEVELLGRRVSIERIGVDGDFHRAYETIRALDGKVDAFGMGGTDLYLVVGKRRYVIEQSRRLAEAARLTPIVDGSGLKNTLERETVRWLAAQPEFDIPHKRVLVVSAVDRFGMAEGFIAAGSQVIFGDLIFALGIPIAIRSLRTLAVLAALFMPIIRRRPISELYPTGEAQETIKPRHRKYFEWADIVAGDFLFIRKYMPERLDGKMIVTNTTTEEDVALLKERGLATLVTTTPKMDGRSFGTNVVEAALVALAGAKGELAPEQYLEMVRQLGWQPRVERLAS